MALYFTDTIGFALDNSYVTTGRVVRKRYCIVRDNF